MERTFQQFHDTFLKRRPYILAILIILFAAAIGCSVYFYWDRVGELLINILASLLAFLGSALLLFVATILLRKKEDVIKVSYEDEKMYRQYKNNYHHSFLLRADSKKKINLYCEKLFQIKPDTAFTINDNPAERFELDDFIKTQCLELLKAHKNSKIEHCDTVRLNGCNVSDDGSVSIDTIRSSYLAHMLTNRAIDYPLSDGISVRSLYENKAVLTPLKDSRLSNHIGINALIFIHDGNKVYLLLPERDKTGTIAKERLRASLATRLKMDDYKGILTADYLKKDYVSGCISEVLRTGEGFSYSAPKISFLGAGRDVYEGGKPTFFYRVDINASIEEYLREKELFEIQTQQRFSGEPATMDKIKHVHVAVWDTVELKKEGVLTFTSLVKKGYSVKTKKISSLCEKNLLGNFWFNADCMEYSEATRSNVRYNPIESLCLSKTGRDDACEDGLVRTKDFVAVIDGVTSKSGALFNGKTGGRIAMELIKDCFEDGSVPRDSDAKATALQLQALLKKYSEENQLEEKDVHLCASVLVYSAAKQQIWAIGDCQYMLNGIPSCLEKRGDRVLSEARSLAIHAMLADGKTEADLRKNDLAREAILSGLKLQEKLENTEGDYGFSAISSRGRVDDVVIINVPDGAEVVLASDGYPVLFPTLDASEAYLNMLIKEDPLCYKLFKSTKGLAPGCNSFDDRTYIRFTI